MSTVRDVKEIANFSEHFWLTDEYWFRAWLDRRNSLRMSMLRGRQWVTYLGMDGSCCYGSAMLYPDNSPDSWIHVEPVGSGAFLMTLTEAVHAQMCVDAEDQDERNRRRHTGRSADDADRGVAVAASA